MSLASLLLIGALQIGPESPAMELTEGDRSRSFDILRRGLEDESPTVRVHAAEALISLHRTEPVLAAYRSKVDTTEPVHRILAWRVLAAAEPGAEKRREYLGRIRDALLDPDGPDQTHAMEALAKLEAPAVGDTEREFIRSVADGAGPASPFALWRLVQAGEADAIDRLVRLLQSKDHVTRFRAVYVLGRIRLKSSAANAALATALATEPIDSFERPILRAALGGDAARELLSDAKAPPGDRYFAAMFLADSGTASDYLQLVGLLREENGDLRVSGAYALLKIESRSMAMPTSPDPEAIK